MDPGCGDNTFIYNININYGGIVYALGIYGANGFQKGG
jgi:hypothetical protein